MKKILSLLLVSCILFTCISCASGNTGKSSNAPVTRVRWWCDNLPDGLELSESGQLSGRPTIAGNYACTVKVATNWGEATKIVNIRVME